MATKKKSCKRMKDRLKYAAAAAAPIGALGFTGYQIGKIHYRNTGSSSWIVPGAMIGSLAGLVVGVAIAPRFSGCSVPLWGWK